MAVVALLAAALVCSTPTLGGAATSHAPVKVPNVIGLTRLQTYAALGKKGITFQATGPGSHDGSWLSVIRQTPRPGRLLRWHGLVHLTVAIVDPHGSRPVPSMLGMSPARVTQVLNAFELRYTVVGPGASTHSWVRVTGQFPYKSTMVRWHSTLLLRVTNQPDVSLMASEPTTTTTLTPVTDPALPGSTTTSTTTTTIKKAAAAKPKRYRIGVATWYSYIPGFCATSYLPVGTKVTVRNLATGVAIRCLVTDLEAAKGNRVVDLSETQFAKLAPLRRGVVAVKVSW